MQKHAENLEEQGVITRDAYINFFTEDM